MPPALSVRGSKPAWVAEIKENPEAQYDQRELAQRSFVRQYTFALAMSQPRLSHDRLDLAYFTQDLYMQGELSLSDFLGRMQRLYPERMDLLNQILRSKLKNYLRF